MQDLARKKSCERIVGGALSSPALDSIRSSTATAPQEAGRVRVRSIGSQFGRTFTQFANYSCN